MTFGMYPSLGFSSSSSRNYSPTGMDNENYNSVFNNGVGTSTFSVNSSVQSNNQSSTISTHEEQFGAVDENTFIGAAGAAGVFPLSTGMGQTFSNYTYPPEVSQAGNAFLLPGQREGQQYSNAPMQYIY